MTDQLKPSNEEIAYYILMWIKAFAEGNMLTIHSDEHTIFHSMLLDNNFETLRSLFTPEMYNSIQEYVEKEK